MIHSPIAHLIDFNLDFLRTPTEISLPANHDSDGEKRLPMSQIFDPNRMHIGGFNLNKNLQQSKADIPGTMNEGILKEINKNTSAENFKVSKKHKFGHAAKKPEANTLCGEWIKRNVVGM